jgi:hypothetical protein
MRPQPSSRRALAGRAGRRRQGSRGKCVQIARIKLSHALNRESEKNFPERKIDAVGKSFHDGGEILLDMKNSNGTLARDVALGLTRWG